VIVVVFLREMVFSRPFLSLIQHPNNITLKIKDETGTNPAHGGRQSVPESVNI